MTQTHDPEYAQRLQSVLDENGHIVMMSNAGMKPGDMIAAIRPCAGYGGVECPLVILGEATREEFEQQRERFFPDSAPSFEGFGAAFYRVIAE